MQGAMTRHRPRVSVASMFDHCRVPRYAAAVLGLLLASEPATAQAPPSDAAKSMVGAWELSDADREKTCTVNFKLGPGSANYPIDPEKKCGEAFPTIRGIV